MQFIHNDGRGVADRHTQRALQSITDERAIVEGTYGQIETGTVRQTDRDRESGGEKGGIYCLGQLNLLNAECL